MKFIFSLLFSFLSFCVVAQRDAPVTNAELKSLVGNWAGTAVNTNFSESNMQTTLQVQLEIASLNDSLIFNYVYTDKLGTQSTRKYNMYVCENGERLSFDSAQYDIVELRRRGPKLFIYAERIGVDNNRTVDFQEEFIISAGALHITKGLRSGGMVNFSIKSRAAFTKK